MPIFPNNFYDIWNNGYDFQIEFLNKITSNRNHIVKTPIFIRDNIYFNGCTLEKVYLVITGLIKEETIVFIQKYSTVANDFRDIYNLIQKDRETYKMSWEHFEEFVNKDIDKIKVKKPGQTARFINI